MWNEKSPAPLEEGRAKVERVLPLYFVIVYARVGVQHRTALPEEGRQRVHMQTCVARIAIIGLTVTR